MAYYAFVSDDDAFMIFIMLSLPVGGRIGLRNS
jgi:hypothetical protein